LGIARLTSTKRNGVATKFNIDTGKIEVTVFTDERRHSQFDRRDEWQLPRRYVGARVVAIKSDRFSTGR
jgi:hypothetical protein